MNAAERKLLEEQFTYHAPIGNQLERYQAIRDAAKVFAMIITGNCPPCADRTAAIRKIREAAMTANAAIAIEEATGGAESTRDVYRFDRVWVVKDSTP